MSGAPLAQRPVSSSQVGAATQQATTIPVGTAPAEDGLENPRWGRPDYDDGDEVEMLVDARGLDGRRVKFVVEAAAGGGRWEKVGEVTATVARGVAVGLLRVEHPATRRGTVPFVPRSADVGPRTLRFEATLA